jgi:hypothetical protein
VLYASRRPVGGRYRYLLAHFGEVVAKKGARSTGEITNRLLNPYRLTMRTAPSCRRLASHGVFVSDHLGLTGKQYLAPLLRDRLENSIHTDIIGSLIEPRGARVVEVRRARARFSMASGARGAPRSTPCRSGRASSFCCASSSASRPHR